MRNVANKIFGAVAAGAMAMTPMAAFSQAAPANQNVDVSVQQPSVQYVDATRETMAGARGFAAAASNDKVAIVVWGGNRAIQQEAYNAALDLADMGIPTAFVLAPDGNGLDGDAHMQIYAASTPRANATYGTQYASEVRPSMREAGIAAYREAFPAQLAVLSIQ
tara:strand:+ start:611 stop:1102 length:492 start_codon:yes stop_codon:yes gene_type:complete